jgi:hypothetical protein
MHLMRCFVGANEIAKEFFDGADPGLAQKLKLKLHRIKSPLKSEQVSQELIAILIFSMETEKEKPKSAD